MIPPARFIGNAIFHLTKNNVSRYPENVSGNQTQEENQVSPNAQLIGFMLAVSIPSLTALVGVLTSNARISDLDRGMSGQIADLRAHMDARFEATNAIFTEKLQRVEEVMDARLTRIEEHLHLK